MEKTYMDKYDIMNRYDVGMNKAMAIIHGIQDFTGNRMLGRGKVLVKDVEYWENNSAFKKNGR